MFYAKILQAVVFLMVNLAGYSLKAADVPQHSEHIAVVMSEEQEDGTAITPSVGARVWGVARGNPCWSGFLVLSTASFLFHIHQGHWPHALTSAGWALRAGCVLFLPNIDDDEDN